MRVSVPTCLSFVLLLCSHPAFAQSGKKETVADIIQHDDSLFWQAYNRCDGEGMRQFLAPDVEFYHDKGGITLGADAVISSMKKNLCSNENFHVRREAVPGTVNVYPLQNGTVTYGAVLSGDHYFYVSEKGKSERADGVAKFFHVWLLKDGAWKMARVISYDHKPVPYVNTRKEVTVSPESLQRCEGRYQGPQIGIITVTAGQNSLVLTIGDKKYSVYPESEHVFFGKDRDLTFEFGASTVIVRERGDVAERLNRVK
jgi:hypothetical protein